MLFVGQISDELHPGRWAIAKSGLPFLEPRRSVPAPGTVAAPWRRCGIAAAIAARSGAGHAGQAAPGCGWEGRCVAFALLRAVCRLLLCRLLPCQQLRRAGA